MIQSVAQSKSTKNKNIEIINEIKYEEVRN